MTVWETIIGLEVHAELNTEAKLFSVAPNRFGDEPNTNITEVCTGQPGALPVLNEEAVRKAVRLGLALDAHVAKFSKFDRKSYFYPDSPRNFQITQLDQPIVLGGEVTAEVGGVEKTFQVNRVHLEDDAGMLKHFSGFAGVDYNRAGVPLVEIVSEPCIRSPQEAVAYGMALKAILQYIDASDCNMQEGSLRMDANISVRKQGEEGLRNKTEIKNMNSFSNMEMAITAEVKRQIRLYEQHPDKDPSEVMEQATYRFDPDTKSTVLMRSKETANDYRYFPEPDLVPIVLSDEYIDNERKALPELPRQRLHRYEKELELLPHPAFLLTSDKALADYFEVALSIHDNAKALANWILVEFGGRLKEAGLTLPKSGIEPAHVAHLVQMIDAKVITGKIAKKVADEMVAAPGKDPKQIVDENPDYKPMQDTGQVEAFVVQVLDENAQSVVDYRNGKDRAFGFLVGQVMKLSKGKAPPQVVNELLKQKLEH